MPRRRAVSTHQAQAIQKYYADAVMFDLYGALVDAVLQGVTGGLGAAQAFVLTLTEHAQNRDEMAIAHRRVAERTQAAVIAAYLERVNQDSQERSSPNRFKGRLLMALQGPDWITSDADGVAFNFDSIYRQAKHFARLDWGAQGTRVQESTPEGVPLQLVGSDIAILTFGQSMRPSFALPPGLFLGGVAGGGRGWTLPTADRRGTGHFVPLGELTSAALRGRAAARAAAGFFNHPTAGIQPRYFLEAGLEEMAVAWPQEYDTLMQDWLQESLKEGVGGTFVGNLRAPGGAGRIRNYRVRSLRLTRRGQYK